MRYFVLLSVLTLSSLLACARDDTATVVSDEKASPRSEQRPTGAALPPRPFVAEPRAAATAEDAPGTPSIYDLEVRLTDQRGAVRALAEFRGHPVLITMFYAGCAAACPLLTSDLKRIERQLPESVRSNVRVLMVSFDAARDTPAVLAQQMAERGMDASRWTLASTPDDEARELAAVLDIRYRKLDNGEFFHSSSIVLLDSQGRIRARVDGVGGDVNAVVSALAKPST